MTKENFEKYDKEKDVFCECCKTNKPVTSFTYSTIRTNTRNATMCRTCQWLKNNHNGNIPIINGFNDFEILNTISFMIEKRGEYVNDLSKIIGRSIDDTIDLIYKLNLKNLHILIKNNCKYCGKEVDNNISVYLNNKHIYCSLDCYWKDKTNKIKHGEDSPFYNRIETTCTNCGKQLKIIPRKYNETNKYGDNHNFCSHKCYSQYRSKYYINEKSSMHNYIYTDEQREKARDNLLNRLKLSDRLDTNIQLKINNILEQNHILYERERNFDYYSVDNFLSVCNGIIEVMGDYWHVSPLKYNENKYLINEMQQKQLHRDKVKYSYIMNHYSIPILYLWESDINNNTELCKMLIEKYIENNRILDNYHSFNWRIENKKLSLNKDIIIPYQDMPVDEYRHLLKKKVG